MDKYFEGTPSIICFPEVFSPYSVRNLLKGPSTSDSCNKRHYRTVVTHLLSRTNQNLVLKYRSSELNSFEFQQTKLFHKDFHFLSWCKK